MRLNCSSCRSQVSLNSPQTLGVGIIPLHVFVNFKILVLSKNGRKIIQNFTFFSYEGYPFLLRIGALACSIRGVKHY